MKHNTPRFSNGDKVYYTTDEGETMDAIVTDIIQSSEGQKAQIRYVDGKVIMTYVGTDRLQLKTGVEPDHHFQKRDEVEYTHPETEAVVQGWVCESGAKNYVEIWCEYNDEVNEFRVVDANDLELKAN